MGVVNPKPEPAVVLPPWCEVAASAYRAYAACLDSGMVMEWERLPAEFQAAWEAAVRQASYILRGDNADESRWRGWKPFPPPEHN